jgi:hypothetical protein
MLLKCINSTAKVSPMQLRTRSDSDIDLLIGKELERGDCGLFQGTYQEFVWEG